MLEIYSKFSKAWYCYWYIIYIYICIFCKNWFAHRKMLVKPCHKPPQFDHFSAFPMRVEGTAAQRPWRRRRDQKVVTECVGALWRLWTLVSTHVAMHPALQISRHWPVPACSWASLVDGVAVRWSVLHWHNDCQNLCQVHQICRQPPGAFDKDGIRHRGSGFPPQFLQIEPRACHWKH